MLAVVALILATVVLFKMKRGHYAWVTILPTIFVLVSTMTAGWQKIFHSNPKIGFLAHAKKLSAALEQGTFLPPTHTAAQMQQVIFNDYVNATLTVLFMMVVTSVLIYGLRAIRAARLTHQSTAQETPFVPLSPPLV